MTDETTVDGIIIAGPDVDPNPSFPIEIDAWHYGANYGSTSIAATEQPNG